MPIHSRKKPAWKIEQERIATIAGMNRTRGGARRNEIADYEDKLQAERRAREAAAPAQADPTNKKDDK